MKNLLLIFLLVTAIAACKKTDNNNGTSLSKKEMLTSGNWRLTSLTAKTNYLGKDTTVDLYGSFFLPCQMDNLYRFNASGTITTDEGTTKCSDTSAQTKTSGTWELLESDTKMQFNESTTGVNRRASIAELNSISLKLAYDTTYLGLATKITTGFTRTN